MLLALCATAGKSNGFENLQSNDNGVSNVRIKSVIKPYIPYGAGDGYVNGQTASFKAECNLYGFSISDNWFPYRGSRFATYSLTRTDANRLQYQTDIQQVLLQNYNDLNAFCVAYRVVTSPVGTRHWGFMGIGSHSDTWYTREVKTTATLGSYLTIAQWSQKNEHASYSGTIGVNAGTDSFSVSASVNYDYSQLQLTSRTNVATGVYETDYLIKGENNYNRYSSEYYGMFTFERDSYSTTPISTLKHTIAYYGKEYFHLESKSYSLSLSKI